MSRRFRKLKSVEMSYKKQGLIYFSCANYRELSERMQEKIMALAEKAAGENASALVELLTTERSAEEICRRHHVGSPTTLYEARKRFYELW